MSFETGLAWQLVHYSENVATTISSNYNLFLCNMLAEFLLL